MMLDKGRIIIDKNGFTIEGVRAEGVCTLDDLRAWLIDTVASTFDEGRDDITWANCSGSSPLVTGAKEDE